MLFQHAWKEKFHDFVECLCLHNDSDNTVYWVCALSIYQSYGDNDEPTIKQQLGDDPDYGPFATVLKGADLMLAVITGAGNFDIYARLW